jgi:hypothetical protein
VPERTPQPKRLGKSSQQPGPSWWWAGGVRQFGKTRSPKSAPRRPLVNTIDANGSSFRTSSIIAPASMPGASFPFGRMSILLVRANSALLVIAHPAPVSQPVPARLLQPVQCHCSRDSPHYDHLPSRGHYSVDRPSLQAPIYQPRAFQSDRLSTNFSSLGCASCSRLELPIRYRIVPLDWRNTPTMV